MGFLNLGKAFHDELTGKIMVVMLFLLFVVVTFVIFLHLYAKWYIEHSSTTTTTTTTTATTAAPIRRRRPDFAPGYYVDSPSISAIRLGLDPTVLESITIMSFVPEDHEKDMECAVCLSELAEGEKFRLLPKCHHGFHVECIDMWFQSHATCPLCRNPIQNKDQITKMPSETTLDSILQAARAENTAIPTNVLFWGNQVSTRTLSFTDVAEEDSSVMGVISSSSSGVVAIDMPREVVVEEDEEQVETVTTRLRRMLSRDRRVNPCGSPSGVASQQ